MKYKDYYDILGVAKDASQDEIKRVYRKLARKYHPDVSKEDNAEARFKEVAEAYEVLKDSDKRQSYDQLGSNWRAGQDFRPPPDWGGFNSAGIRGFDAGQFSDFFENLFGTGRGGAGVGARQRGFRMAGSDQHAIIRISLEDAYHGVTRTISMKVDDVDAQGEPKPRTRSLKVKIPKSITRGQQIRLAGQGMMGYGGAPNGDLYIKVEFEPHPLFTVTARDLYLDLDIAPWEAALGTTVTVPTIGGKVDLKIPVGSQSGQSLRLKGKGLHGKPPGDQYIVLRVVVPQADTAKARALYESMRDEMPINPRAELEARMNASVSSAL